jgi:CheY-like chemotaxis protein
VRDTGPGIAPADRARLFQPFSRLDLTARTEGTGLGLALTAALCRAAGGGLAVESDGRSGSCFRAHVVVRPCAPPPAPLPATLPLTNLRGRRVLIVDDNALVRDLFAAWLADLGAVCELAVDGEDALAHGERATFDAVVLDLAMPRLDGFAVARRWRAQGRAWRIVGVRTLLATIARRHSRRAWMHFSPSRSNSPHS